MAHSRFVLARLRGCAVVWVVLEVVGGFVVSGGGRVRGVVVVGRAAGEDRAVGLRVLGGGLVGGVVGDGGV